eukprot:Protomagalhaensia_sp_Gyna_25__1557@NODE_17_length_8134_cov_42_750093_g11_i0_p5_GENE_NODE_17_length_8134_cov_42_750093_g11_i0NODE_17_length_8134_cov_42_750093_g11_i0_p5_ORF_typecomplete_len215_score47_50DUF1754/PF08555_10/0_0019DUF1754/PF08555_10/1_6e03_NODE_17_length_8134_cov_42_750093_g11_i060016645
MNDDDVYSRPPRGTLKLKSKSSATKKTLQKKKQNPSLASGEKRRSKKEVNGEASFRLADGRIVSNETTVQGFETRFTEEVAVGDTIGVNHPTSLEFEERTVMAILSQRSLIVDMQFSTNLISTCPFFVRPDSKQLVQQLQQEEQQGGGDDKSLEERLQDRLKESMIKKQSTILRVRERKGTWGYKTNVEELDQDLTAEELLDMRIKRTGRDKYC